MRVWWCSCYLLLTITTAAWSDCCQDEPLFRRVKSGEADGLTGATTFGLQVRTELDESPRLIKTSNPDTILQVGHFSELLRDPLENRFEQFSAQQEIEQPALVAIDPIDPDYDWRVLPAGLMYKSYLAGEKESRVQAVWFSDQHGNQVWETTLGGRFGFLRYGTADPVCPEGWQWDFEGAAMPPREPSGPSSPLIAVDFRIGMLSTWRKEGNAFKAGYYHLSSHVGDEFLLLNPGFNRLNYVRDSAIVGWTHNLSLQTQVYGEIAYAMNAEDGALPWEFQYGIQYSPRVAGVFGAPFGAVNGHTREDFNYETSINIVAGWQWWGEQSNHTFRIGLQYYDGPSMQYSFVNRHERLAGWGLWFDY